MENDYPKIGKIEVQISKGCSSTEKEMLDLYWRMEDNTFIGTVKSIYTKYGLAQYEFTKLVQAKSSAVIYTYCENCISYERHEVFSRSSFTKTISKMKRSERTVYNYYNRSYEVTTVKCELCEEKEKEEHYRIQQVREKEEKEEQLKQQQALLKRLQDAINNKHWEKLSVFELQVFHKCIETDFEGVKQHFGKLLGQTGFKKLINVMFKLADLDLIYIHKENNGFISHHEHLNELQNYEEEVRRLLKEKQLNNVSSVEQSETDMLKFKLTINELQNHPDSPKFAGIVTFKEEIRLKPNIEYTFGAWQKANENLYLTIIPTEQIELSPIQTRVSKKPKRIREEIENFLNKIGKGIS